MDAGTSANPTTSFNVISGKGYIDNYLQLNIQNRAATAAASSDIVASNDAATEAINFVDLGINSSGNTSTGVLGGVNTGYLYSTGNDFAIGNATAGRNLNFFTGGILSSNQRMRIDGNGNVGIGTSAPSTKLQVSATTDPLSLLGVQTGTSTSADSILTISSGIVKKLPASTYQVAGAGIPEANVIKANYTVTSAENTSFNASALKTITASVPGATVNAAVIVNPRSAFASSTITISWSRVSSDGIVTIGFNTTANGATLGIVTFDITVIK